MEKRKVAVVGLAMLLLLVMLVPLGCISGGGKIAVISLSGPIQAKSSFFLGSAITPELVREQLTKAERDGTVKAIVIQVESPGGTVAACQEILNEMDRVKKEKPIVVSMGDMAASGGYYISARADKIVALSGTLTGSIGVISQIPNIKGLYDKLGIEMQTFKGGKYKDMYAGLRELTPEEKEIMQELVDQYYEQFIEVVAEGRGLSREKVRSLATGQLYTGIQAKKLGLVDELGGVQRAIGLAAQLADIEQPQVEYYKLEAPSLWSLLGMTLDEWYSLIQMRLLGAENYFLLETLGCTYPEPCYQ